MANVLVERDYLEAIAGAIRARYGNDVQYTPAEMAPAILRIPGGEVPKTLTGITISTPPYQVNYKNGDTFNTAGMVVTAHYSAFGLNYGDEVISDYSLSPSVLSDGDTEVIITYSEGDVTATAAVSITVTPTIVDYIFVAPTKTEYVYGDTVDNTGMQLTALLSNGTVENLTNEVSIKPSMLTTVTTSQTIVVTYKEKSWSFVVSVGPITVPKPVLDIMSYVYTGSDIEPVITGYNVIYMTRNGDYTAINVGTYSMFFTPKTGCAWDDDTTDPVTLTWNVTKAKATVTLSNTTVTLTADKPSAVLTVGGKGTGTLELAYDSTKLDVDINGTEVTITKLDVIAEGNYTVEFQRLEDDNHTVSSIVTLSVTITSATSVPWGANNEVGDLSWWTTLKEWVATADSNSLSKCVGKTKLIEVTDDVFNPYFETASTHKVRCIGYNCDRDKNNVTKNTLTFQTEYGIMSGTKFTDLATAHERYRNALQFKDLLCTVSKGRCLSPDGSNDAAVTYEDMIVFSISETEFGIASNYGPGYEFCEQNTDRIGYQAYTSYILYTREKKCDNNYNNNVFWWTRSYLWDRTYMATVVSENGSITNSGRLPNATAYVAPLFVI